MNRTSMALLTTVAALAMVLLGCRLPALDLPPEWGPPAEPPSAPGPTPLPPTPTSVVLEANYASATTGLSISYPDDWAFQEFVGEVVFASSAQILTGEQLESGAAMMVTRTDLEGSLTLDELLETTLVNLYFDKVKLSDHRPRSIGGHDGILVTLKGRPAGGAVLMRGFLAGVEHDGWGHLFLAASISEEWPEHGPVLEQMLSSVEFQCLEPIYSSPTLGISITYPEGWVFEEQGEQVIFVSSWGMLSNGVLGDDAVMLVIGSELGEGQTFEEMVEMMLSELSSEEEVTGERMAHAIGEEDGIIVPFEGTPTEGFNVRGFVAAVAHCKTGYVFVGFSAPEGWCEYESVLHSMLDSVEFLTEH
jgi:hypothetical protein